MKKLLLIVAFFLSFITTPCYAGGYLGIVQPMWNWGGLQLFLISGQGWNQPACANQATPPGQSLPIILTLREAPTYPWSNPANDIVTAQQEYASLEASFLAGRQVYLVGIGTCNTNGTEIIYQIWPY